MPWDVIVIGAGAAGIMASIRAAECGRKVLLVEKNRKAGVKILMSGGTRCNLTHATDARGIVEAFGRPGRFLHSALAALGPADLVDLFEAEGVATKVEETGKVFPVSNRALDVLQALLRRLDRSGVELALDEGVRDIRRRDEGFEVVTGRRTLRARHAVLATGGKSYPGCGTTGDGYAWARALGHTIVPPRPALVPLTCDGEWIPSLKGITIPDVEVRIITPADPKGKERRRGSFLFTHFGVSGPAVMDISRVVTAVPDPASTTLVCDFRPDSNAESLAAQLDQLCRQQGRKEIANTLATSIPRRMADVVLRLSDIAERKLGSALTRRDAKRIVENIKSLRLPITGTMGYPKAEVTAGGVALDEVDSRTMESKRVPGLYVIGEVLDLDGPIGGYNFQAAFSAGWLAGGEA